MLSSELIYIYILKKEDVEFYDQLPIIPLCFAGFSRQCQVGLRIFCQQSRRNQILDLKNMEWDLWRGRRYWIVIKAVKCKENSSSVVIGERLRRFHWSIGFFDRARSGYRGEGLKAILTHNHPHPPPPPQECQASNLSLQYHTWIKH